MIIEHNGKRLAFGLNWKSRLSEGDVHGDARAVKSKYFWYADRAAYFGTLPEEAGQKKQKASRIPAFTSFLKKKEKSHLYAGAVALLHRYPDVPNLVMVLEIPKGDHSYPDGAYIVCGIHQSRPRSGYDRIVKSEVEVSELLKSFKQLCGVPGFDLYGDVKISGIKVASRDDVHKGADQAALMRKTKSAMVNPLVFCAVAAVVIGALGYAFHAWSQFQKAEAQRLAMAAQKNSQQLYDEELAARRLDSTLLAKDLSTALAPLRQMGFSLGGWPLSKAICTLAPDKQMACTFDYLRPEVSRATYETFVAASKQQFDNVEFAGRTIKATKVFKSVPFTEQGKAIDAAKTQRDEVIEFGSTLQRFERFGKSKREEYLPFAMPPGTSTGELTSPPVVTAAWDFTTPFRNLKELAAFPGYATVSQVAVTYTDKPEYEFDSSLAMVTVTGKIFSKPN